MTAHLVFVYGTLREGQANHHWLVDAGAISLGSGQTEQRYTLYDGRIPYVTHAPATHHVRGEVYQVDDVGLALLDVLEGHPLFYVREQVPIHLDSGALSSAAWLYFLERVSGAPVSPTGDYVVDRAARQWSTRPHTTPEVTSMSATYRPRLQALQARTAVQNPARFIRNYRIWAPYSGARPQILFTVQLPYAHNATWPGSVTWIPREVEPRLRIGCQDYSFRSWLDDADTWASNYLRAEALYLAEHQARTMFPTQDSIAAREATLLAGIAALMLCALDLYPDWRP